MKETTLSLDCMIIQFVFDIVLLTLDYVTISVNTANSSGNVKHDERI